MKTQMNISSLKRLAVTASVVVLIGTALTAQPKPENNTDAEIVAWARLDNLMNSTEKSIKYEAPDTYAADEMLIANENKEVENAFKHLELLANSTEKDLQYVAPKEEVDNAMQNLELLASATEKELAYKAPSAETVNAMDNLALLAENTEKEIQYQAPDANVQLASIDEKPVNTSHERSNRPVQFETYTTLQENWLINAGYFKSTRTPVWNQVKNNFRNKRAAKHYASKF
jgi:hypothetical protein